MNRELGGSSSPHDVVASPAFLRPKDRVLRWKTLVIQHRLWLSASLLGLGLLLGFVAIYSDATGLLGSSHLSPGVLGIGVVAMVLAGAAVLILLVSMRDEELGLSAVRLLNAAPSALLLLDQDLRIRYANPASERLLSRSGPNLIGLSLPDLFPPGPNRPSVAELLDETFVQRTVAWRATPGGGVATQQIEITIDHGEKGRHALVVLLQDVTDRARLVDALAERAAELSRSNRELEQFAYVASHDLQEPLRMVGSYTQLLESRYRGRLDRDADDFLRFAHDGALRMKQLVDDLLLYARLDSRAQPPTPVDLEEVLAEVLRSLCSLVESARAEVSHTSLPTLDGDRPQMVQLFQNLIGNAIKFHGRESPCISITATRSGDFWEFCVEDNGLGIPPESQERVFLMFQRLHTREEYPGSGIGLAVCKKVVERHGGRIWIESLGVAGLGSKIHFTLRAKPPLAPTRAPPRTVSPQDHEAAHRARAMIEERLQQLG